MSQEGGVKNGGSWRILRVPDWRHGGHGHSYVMKDVFYPKEYTLKSLSGMGNQEGGYLEDIQGS